MQEHEWYDNHEHKVYHMLHVNKINQTKDDIIALLQDRHNITDPERNDFQATTLSEARVGKRSGELSPKTQLEG